MSCKIIPVPSPLSQPYFDGCREGELRLQFCNDCQRHQFYPRILCSHCGGASMTWAAASGLGEVASFTVVRRAVSPAYSTPHVIALIDLDEGPRMMAAVSVTEPCDITVGARVTVNFEVWSETITMPVFSLVADS